MIEVEGHNERYTVRMTGLTREQRDALLSISQAWDSFYEDGLAADREPDGSGSGS